MTICPIILQFSTKRAPSMHDATCEFACAETISANVLKFVGTHLYTLVERGTYCPQPELKHGLLDPIRRREY